ncbi:hypothetical protein BAUCODRAFT_126300 [Baudoinia panamericana UAMH 10762]|uniref:HMG box domain-containing protein n=1 Tax=Baudoinia panamericana (strain UAMH 10762) TaxID=717646 RepID=M2MLP4_BAUPA|nr:uncharacterized protein BAUCODRAFT_126300 [Baudoinia panamericana UAMH 10762]EMC92313.1 hypothetical protein BAUCODRAFT_126300 [Baudoinia panamericana UAMH 10762]
MHNIRPSSAREQSLSLPRVCSKCYNPGLTAELARLSRLVGTSGIDNGNQLGPVEPYITPKGGFDFDVDDFNNTDNVFGNFPQAQNVILMQQHLATPKRKSTVAPVLPSAGPPGASWHAEIGWYFPAVRRPLPGVPLPVATPDSFHPPSATFGSVAQPQMPAFAGGGQVSMASQQQQQQFQPLPVVSANRSATGKRKFFGPQFHEEQQQQQHQQQQALKARGGEVEESDALFVSEADADAEGEEGAGGEEDADFGAAAPQPKRPRTKLPSADQICICPPTAPQHIPRPSNSFMIYRRQNRNRIAKALPPTPDRSNQGAVSHQAGKMWKAEPAHVKAMYERLAQREKAEHERKYPGYRYRPRGKGGRAAMAFGSPGCRCGAYERNVARVREEEAGLVEGQTPVMVAPVAQMVGQQQQQVVLPQRRTQSQVRMQQARAVVEEMPAAPEGYVAVQQPVGLGLGLSLPGTGLRRSSRHANTQAVTYPHPEIINANDDDHGEDDHEATLRARITEQLHTNAVATAVAVENSPPAMNTRSKSRSQTHSREDLGLPDAPAESGFLFPDDEEMRDLFGDAFLDSAALTELEGQVRPVMEEEEGEEAAMRRRSSSRRLSSRGSNIVVATKRSSSASVAATAGLRRSPRTGSRAA